MSEQLNDTINVRGEVDAWARIAIERFRKELNKKHIGVTGALYRSFERELKRSNGDVQAVFIRFNFYGRLRDMGVGRGLKAYERHSNRQNLIAAKAYGAEVNYVHRQPKRWFNKPKMAQIYKLREILERSLDHAVVKNVTDHLTPYTEYRVNI